MNNIYKFILAIFIPISVNAQFQEDFSDGDFLTSPTWSGNVEDFAINMANELQLQAMNISGNQVSYLSTLVMTADSTVWEFFVRLDFSPSGENFARIYLSADRAELNDNVRGYYLKIGSGGSDDALELYRQDEATHELLLAGTIAAVANTPTLNIRVVRNPDQEWTLFADYDQSGNFINEGKIKDGTYRVGQYFGWQCNYTSSRSDKFFLDNILIDPLFIDNIPPRILSVEATSENTIAISFDEYIEENNATDINNYSLSPSISIANARIDDANPQLVILTTNSSLVDGTTYELNVENISDLNGNTIDEITTNFTFTLIQTASAYDILINEIMVDPIPVLGLPEAEFIEIYNRSNKNINVGNFELIVGNTIRLLPDFILAANEYAVIVDNENAPSFSGFGKTIALEGFPVLRNSGEQISLYNSNSELLHAINYRTSWYQNNNKVDGGFTLELMNPLAPCLPGIENWSASENGNGGTPGRQNSIISISVDETPPDLLRAFPINAERIRLFFNKKLDLETAENIDNYQLENIEITSAELEFPNAQTVILNLSQPLNAGQGYTLKIERSLTDCIGNNIGMFAETQTALPATIQPQDMVINEVLYHPEVGGSDFVELYNQSDKVLNVADLLLANRNEEGIIDIVRPIETNYLLFPEQYVVLTEEVQNIIANYPNNPCGNSIFGNNFLETDLPTYPTEEGTVVIYLPDSLAEKIIDEFTYSDDLHHPLLDDTRGVSLERIDTDLPATDNDNWHSAATTVGFASPGCTNSHALTNRGEVSLSSNIFSLERTTFSPDGDGFEDFLIINYETERSDFIVTLRIYDMNGKLLKSIATNESLASAGFYKWDGSTENGEKAKLGIYIIYAEVFAPDGTQQEYKETCVLAGYLD